MYKEIEMIIFTKKLSKEKIARELGITYGTFLLKLRGANKFTLNEALALKSLLGTDMPVEELFAHDVA